MICILLAFDQTQLGRQLTILSWEEWLSTQHLRQNTSHGPDINGLSVLLESQHDLRRTVPSRGNILGHETAVVFLRGGRASKSEIANLQVAVGVQQQVRRLQVAVENVGGVHGLQGTESLVNEVLAVIIGQILGTDNAVHVRLHELLNEVDLGEVLVGAWLLDVKDGNDVLVVEVAEELHLAESAKAEHGVIERGDLFDGNLLSRWLVKRRAGK